MQTSYTHRKAAVMRMNSDMDYMTNDIDFDVMTHIIGPMSTLT